MLLSSSTLLPSKLQPRWVTPCPIVVSTQTPNFYPMFRPSGCPASYLKLIQSPTSHAHQVEASRSPSLKTRDVIAMFPKAQATPLFEPNQVAILMSDSRVRIASATNFEVTRPKLSNPPNRSRAKTQPNKSHMC